MSRGSANTEKQIYYDESQVTIKDANDKIIGVFPLKKIYPHDIQRYREKIANLSNEKRTKALLIIRSNDKYYVAVIPKALSLTTVTAEHLCGNCVHCYAKSKDHVGCPKVSDRHFDVTIRTNSVQNAIKFSSRLEKYLFISTGLETFGCEDSDIFIVSDCKHFCFDSREPKKARIETSEKLFDTYKMISNQKDVPIPCLKHRKKVLASYNAHPYQ